MRFVERIQQIQQQGHGILQNINSRVINNDYSTSKRLATKFGCICRTRGWRDQKKISDHSNMDHRPTPIQWEKMPLTSIFHPFWALIQCLMWKITLTVLSTSVGYLGGSRVLGNNKVEYWLYSTSYSRSGKIQHSKELDIAHFTFLAC